MVQYGIMSIFLTALAATRHCAAFNVASNLKYGHSALARMSKSTTSLAASDNDFDDFSSKVSVDNIYFYFILQLKEETNLCTPYKLINDTFR